MRLECVFQRKLDRPVSVDGARDLPEVAIRHATVWRRVVSDVEGVEQVGTEVQTVFAPERKAFEDGHVDILKTWGAQRSWTHPTERAIRLFLEDAVSIVCVGSA